MEQTSRNWQNLDKPGIRKEVNHEQSAPILVELNPNEENISEMKVFLSNAQGRLGNLSKTNTLLNKFTFHKLSTCVCTHTNMQREREPPNTKQTKKQKKKKKTSFVEW